MKQHKLIETGSGQIDSGLIGVHKTLSGIASVIVVCIGLIVLAGWRLDVHALQTFYFGESAMKANAALAFVLSGFSLWLVQTNRQHRTAVAIARLCSVLVILIGFLTLMEDIVDLHLGIDEFLAKEWREPILTSHPGRMAPNAAVNFILIGTALLMIDKEFFRGIRPSQILTLLAGVIATLALLGYIYNISTLYSISSYTAMAFPAATAFALLCLGILFARPDKGMTAILVSSGVGGIIARRFLLAAFAIPLAIDALLLPSFLTCCDLVAHTSAIRTILIIGILSIIALKTSVLLNAIDTNRKKAQEEVQSVARFPDENPYPVMRISHDFTILYANESSKPLLEHLCTPDAGCSLCITPTWHEFITRSLQTGQKKIFEERLGENMFLFTITPISSMSYVNIYGYDITKRVNAEKALLRSETKYRILIEHASDGITIADEEGNYLEVNSKACEMLGYSKEDFLHRTVRDMVHPEDLAKTPLRFDELKSGTTVIMERRLLCKDGSFLHTEISAKMIPDGRFLGIIRDTTERMKYERELRLFSQAIKEAMDGIQMLNLQGTITFANKACADITGYSPDELIGMKANDLNEDPALSGTTIIPAIKKTGRWAGEIMAKHKTGRIYPAWLSASLVQDDQGQPVALLGIMRDLTSRKVIEDAYRASEKTMRTLMNAITESVILLDRNYTVLTINITGAQRLGLPPDGIIGRNIFDFLPPDVVKRRKLLTEKVIETGIPITYEDTRNGFTFFHHIYPVMNDKGKVEQLAIFAIDISERQKTLSALLESEEKFRSLADQSPNIIYIHKKGAIVYANDKCLEVMEYTREELYGPGFNLLFFIAPDSVDTFTAEYERRLQGMDTPPFETRLATRSGKKVDVIISAKIIQYEGEESILGIVTDITAQKKVEEDLKKSLLEKEMLLKEVHHRVKNNLQIITGLIGLQFEFIKDESCKTMLRESQSRIKSIALVHDRLYRTKGLAEIHLNEYVESFSKELLISCGADGNRITLHLDLEPVTIGIDNAVPCGLIVNELLTNALKHAFPGNRHGDITIAVHVSKDNEIEFIIGDNGIGFPEQIDFRKTSTLGLHIVTTLVKQLRGTITLRREQGTEFRITFTSSSPEEGRP